MGGTSRADLVETDQGHYVVKWAQNAQHRRTLINEAISSELLKRLSIPSPQWAIVHADDCFVRANPQAGCGRLESGLHFGSKFPGAPEQIVLDRLPLHAISLLENRDDFVKVFVFDEWANNYDGRQAIFFRQKESFSAQMIDNGFVFGFDGIDWHYRDRIRPKQYPFVGDIYSNAESGEHLLATILKIRELVTAGFDGLSEILPSEWVKGDEKLVARLFAELARRCERLPDMLQTQLRACHHLET
jgi:HipA-like protein